MHDEAFEQFMAPSKWKHTRIDSEMRTFANGKTVEVLREGTNRFTAALWDENWVCESTMPYFECDDWERAKELAWIHLRKKLDQ